MRWCGYLGQVSILQSIVPCLLSNKAFCLFYSYSLSLIDALDTLIVMGLHEEFNKAVDYITYNVSFDADINVSVFETNIRVVGGLLSAHMLSHRFAKFYYKL